MHEIYNKARQVVVWRGPATPGSSQPVDFARSIYQCFILSAEGLHDEQWSEYPDPPKRLRIVEDLVVPQNAPAWVDRHRLLNRRWWERAWIL